jgi:hypothetical protein
VNRRTAKTAHRIHLRTRYLAAFCFCGHEKTEEPGERRRASSAMGKSGAERRKDRPSQAERQGQEDLREDSEEIFHNGSQ